MLSLCTRARGSEFSAVVMPMYPGPKQLAYRNLLYTAITRAKDLPHHGGAGTGDCGHGGERPENPALYRAFLHATVGRGEWMKPMRIASRLFALLYPQRCVFCGRDCAG